MFEAATIVEPWFPLEPKTEGWKPLVNKVHHSTGFHEEEGKGSRGEKSGEEKDHEEYGKPSAWQGGRLKLMSTKVKEKRKT